MRLDLRNHHDIVRKTFLVIILLRVQLFGGKNLEPLRVIVFIKIANGGKWEWERSGILIYT